MKTDIINPSVEGNLAKNIVEKLRAGITSAVAALTVYAASPAMGQDRQPVNIEKDTPQELFQPQKDVHKPEEAVTLMKKNILNFYATKGFTEEMKRVSPNIGAIIDAIKKIDAEIANGDFGRAVAATQKHNYAIFQKHMSEKIKQSSIQEAQEYATILEDYKTALEKNSTDSFRAYMLIADLEKESVKGVQFITTPGVKTLSEEATVLDTNILNYFGQGKTTKIDVKTLSEVIQEGIAQVSTGDGGNTVALGGANKGAISENMEGNLVENIKLDLGVDGLIKKGEAPNSVIFTRDFNEKVHLGVGDYNKGKYRIMINSSDKLSLVYIITKDQGGKWKDIYPNEKGEFELTSDGPVSAKVIGNIKKGGHCSISIRALK